MERKSFHGQPEERLDLNRKSEFSGNLGRPAERFPLSPGFFHHLFAGIEIRRRCEVNLRMPASEAAHHPQPEQNHLPPSEPPAESLTLFAGLPCNEGECLLGLLAMRSIEVVWRLPGNP